MISGAAIPIPSTGFRYAAASDGTIYSLVRPAQLFALKPTRCADGYCRVNIHFEGGKKQMMAVHRLVAEVHCPNPTGLPEVNHLDGKKTHNTAGNLEWCDRAGNIRHAVATGLHRGHAPHALACQRSVSELRGQGLGFDEIAQRLGCSVSTAHRYSRKPTPVVGQRPH